MEEDSVVRADRNDYWFRHLIKPSEVHSDDAERLKYWENAFQKPTVKRSWVREVSGRVYSAGRDIAAFASTNALQLNARLGTTNRFFRGVYYTQVSDIAAEPPGTFDVWLEPIPDDAAHAELVVTDGQYFDETGKLTADIALDHLVRVMKFANPESEVFQPGGILAP